MTPSYAIADPSVEPHAADPLLSAPRPAAEHGSFAALATLVARLDGDIAQRAGVIPWGSPIPTFGDLARARVATLGLNPSNREFVDEEGNELTADRRRFHTLRSLGLSSWADADASHLQRILVACCNYFQGNPYDRWFKRLDSIVTGTGASFYNPERPACHLDVIPYATATKWTSLGPDQRADLLDLAYDTLGLLLRNSSVRILILNGQSVVEHFGQATGIVLDSREVAGWSLPRKSGRGVRGIAYHGIVDMITGYRLNKDLVVLGYNHNLQSSFGVTTAVVEAIRCWITETVQGILR